MYKWPHTYISISYRKKETQSSLLTLLKICHNHHITNYALCIPGWWSILHQQHVFLQNGEKSGESTRSVSVRNATWSWFESVMKISTTNYSFFTLKRSPRQPPLSEVSWETFIFHLWTITPLTNEGTRPLTEYKIILK